MNTRFNAHPYIKSLYQFIKNKDDYGAEQQYNIIISHPLYSQDLELNLFNFVNKKNKSLLYLAIENNLTSITNKLWQHFKNSKKILSEKCKPENYSLAHVAAKVCSLENLKKIINCFNANRLNWKTRDYKGNTALHILSIQTTEPY